MSTEGPSQFWILPWFAQKCAAVQEKSLDSSGDQQEKSKLFRELEKLQNGKHSGKSGWLVDLSKRLAHNSLHNVCKNFLPGRLIYADWRELPTFCRRNSRRVF